MRRLGILSSGSNKTKTKSAAGQQFLLFWRQVFLNLFPSPIEASLLMLQQQQRLPNNPHLSVVIISDRHQLRFCNWCISYVVRERAVEGLPGIGAILSRNYSAFDQVVSAAFCGLETTTTSLGSERCSTVPSASSSSSTKQHLCFLEYSYNINLFVRAVCNYLLCCCCPVSSWSVK